MLNIIRHFSKIHGYCSSVFVVDFEQVLAHCAAKKIFQIKQKDTRNATPICLQLTRNVKMFK